MIASEQKRALPVIAKIAVKKGVLTKEQLKRALLIVNQETNEGKNTSLPEVLVKTGMLSIETMAKLHDLASRYTEGQTEAPGSQATAEFESHVAPEKPPDSVPAHVNQPESTFHRIDISDDTMSASVIFPKGTPRDISANDLLKEARNMGIVHGLVFEETLQYSLQNGEKDSPVLIARGTPPHPGKSPVVDFHFDSEFHRKIHDAAKDFQSLSEMSPPEINDGELLAEKTPLIPSDSGMDVFGRTIKTPPVYNIVIRSGHGAEMFDDQLKIFSTIKGFPFLSVEGVIHVFPLVSLKTDYGITSGPVARDSCLKTTGVITGEYPVKGGHIIADEIRGATIDVFGSIVVQIGITRSVIKAQGDIWARSIRGCTIETYGSVYVENEIMDSTIYASGQCVCKSSKIIASTIFASKGVRAANIGTATSVPCEITVGDITHTQRLLASIDHQIQKNTEQIETFRKTFDTLSEEQKKLQSQLPPLVSFHKKAVQALNVAEARIEGLKQKKLRKQLSTELGTFNELKAKDQSVLQAIRNISDRLKEIQNDIKTIPEHIRHRKFENEQLGLDRISIASWAKTLSPTPIVEVSGDLNSDTVISSPHASLTIETTVSGVMVKEETLSSGDKEHKLVIKKRVKK